MSTEYIIVYIVFVLLMSVVFEIIDRALTAVKKKVKAKKLAKAQQSISCDEEV